MPALMSHPSAALVLMGLLFTVYLTETSAQTVVPNRWHVPTPTEQPFASDGNASSVMLSQSSSS